VEKEQFADTSFKRLYWTGYRGTMGALKWPTGWFNKPAHIYGATAAFFALPNSQNYGGSESVARRVGVELADWLGDLNGYSNYHVFAHSMGNVVISEALRHSNGRVLTSYVATEAAEVSGSYDQSEVEITHKLLSASQFFSDCSTGAEMGPEEAGRCYNSDNLLYELFDMPPDKYRYDIPERHGPTNTEYIAQKNNRDINLDGEGDGVRDGQHYYECIGNRVDNLVNFYNGSDAALSAWQFNQLTKPDLGVIDGSEWAYEYNGVTCSGLLEVCDVSDLVSDRVLKKGIIFDDHLFWNEDLPIDQYTAYIMGYIIPARTDAMGSSDSVNGEMRYKSPLNFVSSNQDHSAQFHGYLSEERTRGKVRLTFWENIMNTGFDLSNDDYSGLKRTNSEK
jgi:hypothetical protein